MKPEWMWILERAGRRRLNSPKEQHYLNSLEPCECEEE